MSGAATTSVFMKQLKEMVLICGSGITLFAGYSIYEGNEKFYRQFVMPTVRLLDPETTHNFALFMAKNKLVPRPKKPDPPSLHTKVWDREFPNPVGVAAGFDKDAVAVDGMLCTGFGFVEVGSVTPEPQPGNPKPRLFRLWEDKAVINRFGFNSEGHAVVRERLIHRNSGQHFDDKKSGIIGINLGKNKTSDSPVGDYVKGVERFGALADYLVINVSSPNTPGLRSMQGKQQLEELVEKVWKERENIESKRKPPLLVKIAPDLTDQDKKDITDVVLKTPGRIDGLIVTNTTITRPESLKSKYKGETGGLSGEPLKYLSTQTVKDMYRLTQGKLPIIGVGGVASGQDAYDKIRAGASLVQLYSALVYQGPPVVSRIKRELGELLEKDGFSNVSEAVGVDVNLNR
ncbi:dihydroorotate dehydrogenase (quinone), mitochondrial-like isoform X2 [Ruditapes philippinarum]|uniref:dihydroorotate dehydrogenase (quinone), mitochondrial-like isoform X2 n=1 Tax=Ruditapes philippinarum TaxID=129788 RepID=UPI00295BBF10|nr:dihydroorotate dehydrogenase (quinone), mitochondrial-like isoform X2 [Ruditapes philippinarum]